MDQESLSGVIAEWPVYLSTLRQRTSVFSEAHSIYQDTLGFKQQKTQIQLV